MPPKRSIFFDDWRDCLHAHYEYVVRAGDVITEPTLRYVIQHAGLSDEELNAIRAEALSGSVPDEDRVAAGDEMSAPAEADVVDAASAETGTDAGDVVVSNIDAPQEHIDILLDDAPRDDASQDDMSQDDGSPDEPPPSRPNQLTLF